MGFMAVMLLAAGHTGKVVAMKGDRLVDYDINEALEMKKSFDFETYRMFTAMTFLDKNTLLQSFAIKD